MKLTLAEESWPLKQAFTISRASRTATPTVYVRLQDGDAAGHGEGTPLYYRGETVKGIRAELEALRPRIEAGLCRHELVSLLPAGAARNALDAALWDLEAKRSGRTVWQLSGITPRPLTTAYTISLDAPDRMADEARARSRQPVLKLKVDAARAVAIVGAVAAARPDAELVADANEAFTLDGLKQVAPAFADCGVRLIEQPLPKGADEALSGYDCPVPLCADESCQTLDDLDFVEQRYGFINIKLDKAGGLTHALAMAEEAARRGLRIMVGCMLGTSLGMAPATVVAQKAEIVDLDGPLLLAKDWSVPLRYKEGILYPPSAQLWG